MKIASVVGARPQFIKLAQLSKRLHRKHREVLIDKGRIYDDEMATDFCSDVRTPKLDRSSKYGRPRIHI